MIVVLSPELAEFGQNCGHDLALNFNKMNLERHLAICTAAQVLKKAFYIIHINNTYSHFELLRVAKSLQGLFELRCNKLLS
jgi:hypothetical protein